MSAEQNKELCRRWWDELSRGTAPGVIDEMYAPDYILHTPSMPNQMLDRQGIHNFIDAVLTGFPDGRYTVEDLISEGDKVFQRVSVQATHTGPFMNIPATGRPVSIWIMLTFRFADGQFKEGWQLYDLMGLLQQIGAIPTAT